MDPDRKSFQTSSLCSFVAIGGSLNKIVQWEGSCFSYSISLPQREKKILGKIQCQVPHKDMEDSFNYRELRDRLTC